MSLKAFHVFFISIAIVLTVGLGIWSTRAYLAADAAQNLVLAVVSFGGALAMAVYGIWFLRKLRNVSYL